MKKGHREYEFLKSALRKCQDNEIPSNDENRAIVSFVDKFVTCSLQDPRSSKIAASVQRHHHTFTCRKAGSICRFNPFSFANERTEMKLKIYLSEAWMCSEFGMLITDVERERVKLLVLPYPHQMELH